MGESMYLATYEKKKLHRPMPGLFHLVMEKNVELEMEDQGGTKQEQTPSPEEGDNTKNIYWQSSEARKLFGLFGEGDEDINVVEGLQKESTC